MDAVANQSPILDDDDIKEGEQKWRKLERLMKSNSCPDNDENFKKQKNHVNWLLDKSRTDYYSAEIEKCGTDQKTLFNLVKSLSGQVTDTPLPPPESIKQLAEDFGNFFVDKIRVICTKLDSDASIMEYIVSDPFYAEIIDSQSWNTRILFPNITWYYSSVRIKITAIK